MVAWAGVERLRLGLEEPPPPLEEADHTNVSLFLVPENVCCWSA